MSVDDDKYPEESDRRRFVKGVVGSAALASLGTAATATANTLTAAPGGGGGPTQFFGIENTDGPAPRGMPTIPIEIDDEGFLRGFFPEWETVTRQGRQIQVAEAEVAGYTYSAEWFQYCGVQTYPGLQPEAEQDDYFRYAPSSPYQWQDQQVEPGARINVSDFEDYLTWGNEVGRSGLGKPAFGTWRSQDVPSSGTIPIQVLRIPPEILETMREGAEYPDWLDAAIQDNFLAWLNKCTHFCCVPSYKGTEQAAKFDAENDVYCPCHQSVYDPFSVIQATFIALPRPDE